VEGVSETGADLVARSIRSGIGESSAVVVDSVVRIFEDVPGENRDDILRRIDLTGGD
jgi:actin-like ATPase involved in cell morphogenesis